MSNGPATEGRSRAVVALLTVIAILLGAWALKATYVVTMPLALAFFLAVLVRPVQRMVEERMRPGWRWVGVLPAMGVIVFVLAAGLATLWWSIQVAARRFPEYTEELADAWERFSHWSIRNNLPWPDDLLELEGVKDWFGGMVAAAFAGFWTMVGLLVFVFFLVLLMLLETRDWHEKAGRALPMDRAGDVINSVNVIAAKIRTFLLIRTVVSVMTGLAVWGWLWIMGVHFAFIWGLVAFLLNYVPNIGSIVAVIPPSLMALIQMDIGPALVVLLGLTAINQVIGNFLDPRLQGRSLAISPLVVLASIVLWWWIWGIVGILLAVPMTVTIIIICAHIPALNPVARLLSRNATDELPNAEVEGREAGVGGA